MSTVPNEGTSVHRLRLMNLGGEPCPHATPCKDGRTCWLSTAVEKQERDRDPQVRKHIERWFEIFEALMYRAKTGNIEVSADALAGPATAMWQYEQKTRI